ncbi:MAG: DUF3192 domain-containing protein [Aestuariibacter sp.]
MAKSKAVKRIAIGVALYAVFAVSVLIFYPDNPDTMGWEDREQFNKVQINKLSPGVSHESILELLGSPDISEAKTTNGDILQVMYYRTQHKKADGITSQDECTPLLFKNKKLVAMGKAAEAEFENDS